jgi:uncharacterized membrane protein YfcA
VGLLPFALYALLGVSAGVLIGCVGIGGVILVPILVYVAAVPLPTAIAAAMCAFLVSGLVGVYVFAKAGTVDWRTTAWLCLGAAPAAFAGALLVGAVPEVLIELAIGALTAAAGIHALLHHRNAARDGATALSAPTLTATGAVTGVASAVTGTGGPLVLVPVLLWLEVPVLSAVASAQVIQLPIAAAATGSNVLGGTLDVMLGLALGGGIALGTAAGAKAAHALPTALLRQLVAALLVVVGGGIVLRLALAS